MALLDLQAMELSSELSLFGDDCHGGRDRYDHCCGSGLSLLLCG
jgi:hypothetical protein